MKKRFFMYAIVSLSLMFNGCSTIGVVFTKAQKAKVAKIVLEEVYANGGATSVALAIDGLVLDGKLSKEQGEQVKKAAQKGYDEILEKVDEISQGSKEEITNDTEEK